MMTNVFGNLRAPLVSLSRVFSAFKDVKTKSFQRTSCYQSKCLSSFVPVVKEVQIQPVVYTNEDAIITNNTIDKVNNQIKEGEEGRLFAVVHICGKQFKITAEDIIIIEGYWPPKNGDEIKLEKVMLAGGRDFTLVGRPILPQGLVSVKATVIEKDLSHTKTVFHKRKRKQYMRINFFRSQTTMLRINEIKVIGDVNKHQDVEQYDRIMI